MRCCERWQWPARPAQSAHPVDDSGQSAGPGPPLFRERAGFQSNAHLPSARSTGNLRVRGIWRRRGRGQARGSRAREVCASSGSLWCQGALSLMKEMGCPLWEWATMKVGPPGSTGAGPKASRSASWSWVSTSTTWAPKARTLPSRGQVVGVLGGGALLEVVAVGDHAEVVELELGGGHEGLPVRALLELAVAGQDEDPPRGAVDLGGQGVADGDGQAVPERAGAGLHPGHLGADRVAVEAGVGLDEGVQLGRPQQASRGEGGVQGVGGVPLGTG